MTLPGYVPKRSGDVPAELAKVWATIKAMQRPGAPVSLTTTDTAIYGDVLSSGPRKTVSPTSVGTAATSGQVYSTLLGQLSVDTAFNSVRFYTHVANLAGGVVGLYTGTALNAMTQQQKVFGTFTDATVTDSAFSGSVSYPRNSYVAVLLWLTVGATAPTLGTISPSATALPNLTGSAAGRGSAKLNITLSDLPATTDLTTGWTSLAYTLWVALT